MKHFALILLFAISSLSIAQEMDSTLVQKDSIIVEEQTQPETPRTSSTASKWYYGGNIGFSFWNDYFYLGVYPLVGYKVTPKLSVGGKIGYAYISDDRYEPFPALNTSNYGGSLFSRFRVIPQIYLHAEFAYWSYENISSFNLQENTYNTERYWVPYLFLGGGFSQQLGPNTWAFVEVLFDVIQDEKSPYEDWEPFISFGVGVGF
jgi:hypothetical protein